MAIQNSSIPDSGPEGVLEEQAVSVLGLSCSVPHNSNEENQHDDGRERHDKDYCQLCRFQHLVPPAWILELYWMSTYGRTYRILWTQQTHRLISRSSCRGQHQSGCGSSDRVGPTGKIEDTTGGPADLRKCETGQ